MYCKNCGKQMGNDRFCPYCGSENAPLRQTNRSSGTDSGSVGWGILGFFFPIVGLILFLVWREEKPLSSKAAGIGALVNVIVGAVGSIVAVLVTLAIFGTVFGLIFATPTDVITTISTALAV
ncbi:MAG: zinc ribbon domain-containing protein [Clostridia bacterium]|nr:zinc ribbon domain-containing protein [Clostridia bacterium]